MCITLCHGSKLSVLNLPSAIGWSVPSCHSIIWDTDRYRLAPLFLKTTFCSLLLFQHKLSPTNFPLRAMPEESALSLVACYVPLLPTLVVCIAKLRIILRLMADLPRLPPLIACEQSLRRAHAILQGITGIIRFHTVFQAVSTRYFGVPNRTLPAPWIGGYHQQLNLCG